MCGIVAVTGYKKALPLLMNGLEKLEYRGYDSAGIAIINPNTKDLICNKAKGKLKNLVNNLSNNNINGTVGIATFTMEGVVKFNTTRTGSEIPYGNVTEENVVGWIKTGIGTDQVAEYERLMHDNLIYIHKNNVGITTADFPSHWPEPEAYISTGSAPLGITT